MAGMGASEEKTSVRQQRLHFLSAFTDNPFRAELADNMDSIPICRWQWYLLAGRWNCRTGDPMDSVCKWCEATSPIRPDSMVSTIGCELLCDALYVRRIIEPARPQDMDEILKYFPNLSELQKQQLQLYADRLMWWNTQINLISRQDTEHFLPRHVLHALAIAKSMPFPPGSRILDLGTGGGLPGIPLAIYFPQCTFTLIDGTGKKIKAVQAMIDDLGLKNVTAVHVRAEDFHGDFDFVVSRAVARLKELWAWAESQIQTAKAKKIQDTSYGEGGAVWGNGMIVLKGGDLKMEIAELRKELKGPDVRRQIPVISIHDFFPDPYYLEKFIVFVPVAQAAMTKG